MIEVYLYFLVTAIIFGSIKDLKYRSQKNKIVRVITIIYLYVPIIYAVPALIFSIYTSNWLIFFTFFTYDLIYNITRLIGEKNITRYYVDGSSS